MTKMSWQQQFKASLKNAENLYSKDSTDVSLLLFCLRAKMIPVQDYLNWAKENFQIPVLSEKYFKVHQPQTEFFKKWQKTYTWSQECLPLTEWDGALIIACLEVPTSYPHAVPSIFVLASHEVLEQAWNLYQKSEVSQENGFADMASLAATIVAPQKNDNFFGDNGEIILQDGGTEESEGSLESSRESSSENEETDGEALDLSGEEDAAGSPEGLFLGETLQTPAVALDSENSPVKKGPRTSTPIMSFSLETPEEKTKVEDLHRLEEIPDHEAPTPDKKSISPVSPAVAGVGDLPLAPAKPTTVPGGTAAYILEKLRKQGQVQFDQEASASFQRLKTFFKKSMLLAIGDKDRLVKPLLWDDTFENQNPQTTEFNLKTPSIFKIVSGTQKPYHGFVSVNDLNESFFESWNHGQIPDHVTIIPLMDGDLVVGMLMGLGEKSSYNKNVLQFTEGVAKDLSQKIFKPATSKAA